MDIERLYRIYTGCGCRVSTDSRKISGGELFFALRGENFDGNDYALKALENGASYAVVDRDGFESDDRIVRVDDCLQALSSLATFHRSHVGGGNLKVIGLTGTNGKTTTKNLTALVLGTRYRVTATQGNLNNDIGVPLSLLSIAEDTQVAVIEMGASHPDDIEKLVQVCQPDYGLITNVGKAHLQGFGSLEGVLQAKTALYRYLGAHRGSLIFLNEDDAMLKERAALEPCHSFGYGLSYQGAQLLPVSPDEPFMRLVLDGRTISTRLVGSYNAANVLAAIAVGDYFGVPREAAIEAIESFEPGNKRSQMLRTERNTLIVDAYNANPSSMEAALENFAQAVAERKLALLGEMRELGADSLREHARVLCALRSLGIPAVLVGAQFRQALDESGYSYHTILSDGKMAPATHGGAGSAASAYCAAPGDTESAAPSACLSGRVSESSSPNPLFLWAEDSPSLAAFLAARPVSRTLILVKGSRGVEMEKVIPSL